MKIHASPSPGPGGLGGAGSSDVDDVTFAGTPAVSPGFHPADCLLRGPAKLVRYELFFGLRRRDGTLVANTEWDQFAAENLPACFPDGYTVVTAEGCWKAPDGRLIREPSKWVIAFVPAERPLVGVRVAALLLCWKQFARQEAVLAIRSPALEAGC